MFTGDPAHNQPILGVVPSPPKEGPSLKVNLIPLNPAGSIYRPSSPAAIEAFRSILSMNRVISTVRLTRGRDIEAACGQLAAKTSGNFRGTPADALVL